MRHRWGWKGEEAPVAFVSPIDFSDPCDIKITTKFTQNCRHKSRKALLETVLSTVLYKECVFNKCMSTECLERSVLRYSGRRPTRPGKENRHFILALRVLLCRKINKHRVNRDNGLVSMWHSRSYKITSALLANGVLDTCHSTSWCLLPQEDYYNASLGLSFSFYEDIVSESA